MAKSIFSARAEPSGSCHQAGLVGWSHWAIPMLGVVFLDHLRVAHGVWYSWYQPFCSRMHLLLTNSQVPMSALSSAWCRSLRVPCPLLRCYGNRWQYGSAHKGDELLPEYRGLDSFVVGVSLADCKCMWTLNKWFSKAKCVTEGSSLAF